MDNRIRMLNNRKTEACSRQKASSVLFVIFCILYAAGLAGLFLLNANRLTWMENETWKAQEISEAAEGTVCILPLADRMEMIHTVWVVCERRADSHIGSLVLLDADGNTVGELVRLRCDEKDNNEDWWMYRLSDRTRLKQRKGGSLQLTFSSDPQYGEGGLLYIRAYGGPRESFWIRWTVLLAVFGLVFLGRWGYLLRRGQSPLQDLVIQAMLVMIAAFLSTLIYASAWNFENIDEYDNMIGGLVLHGQHKVIYRDYVTQHTPFPYWLCAGYAAMGAGSPEQFRLLFQLSGSLVMGLLFIRHRKSRSRKAGIALLAILWGPVGMTTVYAATGTILGDHTQAMAMCVLLAEMLSYFEDHRLDTARCCIVSACVFTAVTSAFLSVYALAAAAAAVLAEDLLFRIRLREKPGRVLAQYLRLLLITMAPFAAMALYFAVNHALQDMIDLAFRFNIEVYSKYIGLGTNRLQPVIDACRMTSGLVRELFTEAAAFTLDADEIPQLLMIILCFFTLGRMLFRKRFIPAAGIGAFLVLQAVRDVRWFHSGMFWETLLLFCLIFLPWAGEEILASGDPAGDAPPYAQDGKKRPSRGTGIWICRILAAVWLLGVALPAADLYFYKIQVDFSRELPYVDQKQQDIADLLLPGEEIYFSGTAMFLAATGHLPVNRLIWNYPWYMEWYQDECVEDLKMAEPHVVMYNPDEEVWSCKDFTPDLRAVVEKEYELSDLPDVYIRKER